MKKNKAFILLMVIAILFTYCNSNKGGDINYNDSSGGTGVGGSLARFAIVNNYLYTVDNSSINIFNIVVPSNPQKIKDVDLEVGIETIYAKDNILFIGSQNGMYIYDVSNPEQPYRLSNYSHIYSCDPVVVDEKYAYVTLSTSSSCGRSTNELQIVNIESLSSPYLVKSYGMTNPKGLGIDSNNLFICDNGLKVYDVSNVNNIILKKHFSIQANDVIPMNNILFVIGNDGLYQYSYTGDNISLLSSLLINQ